MPAAATASLRSCSPPCFERVVGIDPNADQIANAIPQDKIGYHCAPAERIPLPDASASLITAA